MGENESKMDELLNSMYLERKTLTFIKTEQFPSDDELDQINMQDLRTLQTINI